MILSTEWLMLAIPGLLLGLYAQFRLRSVYGHYLKVPNQSGISGAEAARSILDHAGLRDVPVQAIGGALSDHYDPVRRQLCLSEANYRGRSLAAVGVAAHEAGHALQHQAAYGPLKLRMTLVPLTSLASNAAMFLFFGGMILGFAKLAMLGVGVYAVLAFFQLVTLPVEFDASRRAGIQLQRLGLVSGLESRGVSKVLNAAALTYVAALVEVLGNLLYFFLLARGDD